MISILIIPRKLEGLEESLASIRAQIGPDDELLLAPLSRSARLRRACADLVERTAQSSIRIVRGSHHLPEIMKCEFLLVFRAGDLLREGALASLRRFLEQNQQYPCVRIPSAAGHRRLFGVPLGLVLGKPYLLHRKLLARLGRRNMLRSLRDDSVDILLAMEEAGGGGWLDEPLLESGGSEPGEGLSSEQALDFLRRYARRRRLPISLSRVEGGIRVQAIRARGIDIELTSRCNARCSFCPQRQVKSIGDMSDAVFKRVLDMIREGPFGTIYFIGRGEPLLHPRFLDYVKEIRDRTGIEYEVFTNGLGLVPEMVDRLAELNDSHLNITINISLHSLKEDTHRELTETDLSIIARNLRFLQTRADRLNITYAFVTNKINEAEMASLRRYLDRTGNCKWDISLVYNKGGAIPEGRLFDRDFYRRHLSPAAFEQEATGPCWYSYCGLYYWVNYQGLFTLCHDDFHDETILGEVGRDNLETVDRRVAELLNQGGAPRCRRCNKRQRELHHGGNIDTEAHIKDHFVLRVEAFR